MTDGDSVKFGPKYFIPKEIEFLKTVNSLDPNTETTFEIFQQVDAKVKTCHSSITYKFEVSHSNYNAFGGSCIVTGIFENNKMLDHN